MTLHKLWSGRPRPRATPRSPESTLQAVVDCIGDVVFQADRSGRLKFLNPAWTRLTGYSSEESLESRFFDFFDPKGISTLRAGVENLAAATVESIREECSIVLKTGQPRWVKVSARPFRAQDGSFNGVAGTVTDIQDRKLRDNDRQSGCRADSTRADIHRALRQPDLPAALQAAANAIKKNLSVSACRIWLYDPVDKQVHLCAAAGLREAALAQDDLGASLALRVATQCRPEICRRPAIDCGVGEPAGEYGIQAAAAFPIFAGASVDAVAAIFSRSEISPRVAQTAESLAAEIGHELERRKADEKFQAVFDHSSEAVLLFDETGVIDCNQAALDLFACPDRALVLGHDPAEFSPEFQPDGVPSVEKRLAHERMALEQGAHRFEWTFRDLRGRTVPLEVNLTALKLGRRVAFLALGHDIAARKQAESAIRATNASVARGSQQIRASLNGILNLTRRLLGSGLTNKQRDLVESIGNSSGVLLTLLNDSLDLARIEAGEVHLVSAPFDLRLALEDVVELLAPKADAKGIDLVLRYSCRLPRRAVGDGGRVRQILTRLVEHAILLTEKGHVAIDIELAPTPSDHLRLAVTVEDTGMAVTAEQRRALFEGLMDFAGSGLGFKLARRLVEHMGGTLSLLDVPGQGNRLWFEILLIRDADEWPARRPSAAALERRVLLVGPESAMRASIAKTLEEWGIEPHVASRADEALAWVAEQFASPGSAPPGSSKAPTPDLVLASSRLSGMSWEEFGRRVIEITGEARPALVLLVGSLETALSADAIRAGWDAVLARNIRMSALLDLLERTPGAGAADNRRHGPSLPIRRNILVATDDPRTFSIVSALAGVCNLSYDQAGSVKDAVALVKQRRHDLAIVDFALRPEEIPSALDEIRMNLLDCTIPMIVAARLESPRVRQGPLEWGACELLSKPIGIDDLERLLFRLTSGPSLAVYNHNRFIERCGGDAGMAGRLSDTFRCLLPSLMCRLMESAGRQNAAVVLDCARRMRSAAAMFSADLLIKACDRLTGVADLRDWGSVPAAASVVKAEAGRLAGQLPATAVGLAPLPAVFEEVPA